MIALSGCAKRNADRELARVVAFIDARLAAAAKNPPRHPVEVVAWTAIDETLKALRESLAALRHREVTPDLPPFEAARTR